MTDLIIISIPLFLIMIIGESIYSSIQRKNLYETKDTLASIALGLSGVGFDLLIKGVAFGTMIFIHQHAIFEMGKGWKEWVIVFFLQDFSFYLMHLMEHKVRFFWAIHVNHHSSEKLNFSTAVRSSVLQPAYRFLFFLPIAFLGFEPTMILFIYSLNQIYTFFLHTETIGKLGPLEWILNTPSHHRVHHGSNPKYLDRNMGQVLICWDMLLGTFQKEEEKVRYGLTKNIKTYNILTIIFHEWVNIYKGIIKSNSFRESVGYLLRPPGWSENNTSRTANQ